MWKKFWQWLTWRSKDNSADTRRIDRHHRLKDDLTRQRMLHDTGNPLYDPAVERRILDDIVVLEERLRHKERTAPRHRRQFPFR